LRKVGFAFLTALLASTTASFMVNMPIISMSMRILAQTTNNRKQEADKLFEEAEKQYITSRFKAALSYLQQALKIYQSIGDRNGEGNSLSNLGIIYHSLGNYTQAINYYQQSLEIVRVIGDQNGEARSLSNLGITYHSLGDYKQAINYNQQSLAIFRAIGNRNGEGSSLNNLGLAYDSLGEYKQAINYSQQSLAIFRAIGNRNEEGRSLSNLGLAYDSLGDYKQAINYYQQSLEIARAIGDRQGERNSLGGLGLAYHSLGDYKQAINYHNQSLEIARAIGDRNGEGNSLGNLGNAYYSLGDYKQAINYHNQSLEIARAIGDRNGEGNSLNNLGRTYLTSGQLKQAENYLQNALQVKESQRSLLGNNHAFKVSFFDTQVHTYRLLQQALIAQKQHDSALEIAERGRARAFAELIVQQQQLSSSLPPNIQQIRLITQQQNATIVYYSIAWDDLYIWVIKPNGQVVFRKVDLKEKNLDTFAEDARIAAATLATLGKVRYPLRSLANDTITHLVRKPNSSVSKTSEISSPPSSNFATLGKVRYPLRSLANDAITRLVRNPNSSVSKTSETPSHLSSTSAIRKSSCRGNLCLQQMHSLLIQPIAEYLPNDPNSRVIFIPHESLFLVPFAALQDQNNKFLIEKHTISIAPSIQVLQLTHQKKLALKSQLFTSDNSIMVVGNPTIPKVTPTTDASPKLLTPLPGAEKEATIIAKMFNTQSLTGNKATKTVVTQQMSKSRYIHLATHVLLNNLSGPGIPGVIVLAPKGKDDGLLSANEVLNMKLNADLVVLSSSDTGRGRITGDGVIGLPRAFISAGTPSIVVSLWSISDESTAFFMPEFYRQLQIHKNKAIALRQAMLSTMKKYPDPRDWSAFLLIGEAD
jgi:CHAT domain-containing protein